MIFFINTDNIFKKLSGDRKTVFQEWMEAHELMHVFKARPTKVFFK